MAYAATGAMYADMGESCPLRESRDKAYGLRDHASDREKFFIAANYDLLVTGNLEKAQQTCELWKQIYPRDGRAHTHLAGLIYPTLGKYEGSIRGREDSD